MAYKKKSNVSKYNVSKDKKKRTYEGIVFDSALEMQFYKEIVAPKMESGEIVYYERQKDYELQPKFVKDGKAVRAIKYRADYYLELANGESVVIDTKGYPDAMAKMKKKMFWYVYPDIRYVWLGYSPKLGGWVNYNDIKNAKSQERLRKRKEKNCKETDDE